ncbi:MAG: hypothetical protein SGJ04_09395 [Bacteroidota bacterium]|nr:hypothetical protein [Bacteroidota bacterium]
MNTKLATIVAAVILSISTIVMAAGETSFSTVKFSVCRLDNDWNVINSTCSSDNEDDTWTIDTENSAVLQKNSGGNYTYKIYDVKESGGSTFLFVTDDNGNKYAMSASAGKLFFISAEKMAIVTYMTKEGAASSMSTNKIKTEKKKFLEAVESKWKK